MAISRVSMALKNVRFALFFYFLNLILQFFSRKIFIEYIGVEVLGLNTTLMSILEFLNLSASGIGIATAYSLYKPLSTNNQQEVIEKISLLGWFYQRVGISVIILSFIIMLFFPWIFINVSFPLWYAYATFLAFVISALLGYFFNYKSIIFSADQREYIVTLYTQAIKCLKIFIQLIAMAFLSNGYVYWILLEVLASSISTFVLFFAVKRYYPWLVLNTPSAKPFLLKYPLVIKKTKQLFVHKISIYVLNQITPLLIYCFTTLTVVAVYGNYFLIMSASLMLVDVTFRGVTAGVGNLIVTEPKEKINKIFWFMVTIRLCLAFYICLSIYFLAHPFVELWLGEEFKLDDISLILMIAITFIQMTRTVDIFLTAYGLFEDVWAPLAESVLNVSLSIILGYYWGLVGILVGVLVSQILFVVFWKAYFLCSRSHLSSPMEYFFKIVKKVITLLISSILVMLLTKDLSIPLASSYSNWILGAFCLAGIYFPLSFAIMLTIDADFRGIVLYFLQKIKKSKHN